MCDLLAADGSDIENCGLISDIQIGRNRSQQEVVKKVCDLIVSRATTIP